MPSPPVCAGPPTRTSLVACGARTARCGRPEGTPEVTNRLGWLDIAEREREALDDYAELRRGPAGRGLPRRRRARAWAARASPRRSSASPSASSTRPALHVLDSTHPAPGARGAQQHRPRPRADDRLLEVRRDDRADVDVQGLLRAPGRRHALRRRDRPGLARSRRWPAKHGFRRVFARRSRHRRALQRAQPVRARPRRRRRDRPRGRARLRDRRRRGVPLASRATPACGSAARSASSPARAATS